MDNWFSQPNFSHWVHNNFECAVNPNLIRGRDYGERSCELHQPGRHMAALTNSAT
jgi:hypothetical protein